MWEGRENRLSPSIGQAGSQGFHVPPEAGHLFFSPENTERGSYLGGGPSRTGLVGTVVSWCTSWAFSWTFLGLQVTVHRDASQGPHCRAYQGACGQDPARFCLLLASSLLRSPHWNPWVLEKGAALGRAKEAPFKGLRVRASADPITGVTARVWPASVPEHCRWWGWAPGWVCGDSPVLPSAPRSRWLPPQVTRAPTRR